MFALEWKTKRRLSATSEVDEISQKCWTRFPARPFFSRAYSPKTCDHSIIGGHFRDRWGSVLKTSFIVTAKIFIVKILASVENGSKKRFLQHLL